MANNFLSVLVASIVSYRSKKIMSLRQVAYKYGVVVQKTNAEEREILRSVKLIAKNLTDGGKKWRNITSICPIKHKLALNLSR
jgi:hypothetical protein